MKKDSSKKETTIKEALILNVVSDLKRNADGISHKAVEDFTQRLDTNSKIEHYASAIRKYSLLIRGIREIRKIEKNVSNPIEVEFSFYSGIFFATSALDSLSCLINDFYNLMPEKNCSFNNDEFLVKTPEFIKTIARDNKVEIKELYDYRNALAHRRTFLVVPAGKSSDKIDVFLVPAKSLTKLTELKSFRGEFTDVLNLLAEFERIVGGIIVRTFVSWPDKKLNKFSD